MKEIRQEVVNYVYKYESEDGLVFNTMKECEDYEQSELFRLKQRYNRLVVEKSTSEEIWQETNCDSDTNVDCVLLKTKEDADIVKGVWDAHYGYSLDDNLSKTRDTYRQHQFAIIDKALEEQDILVIGRGCCCEDDFWMVGGMFAKAQEILENVNTINDIWNERVLTRCSEYK